LETTYYTSVREIESNKYREVLREFEEKQLEITKGRKPQLRKYMKRFLVSEKSIAK